MQNIVNSLRLDLIIDNISRESDREYEVKEGFVICSTEECPINMDDT